MAPNVTTSVELFQSKSFDIIIVGGGTAGLVLASRLSEHSDLQIGVIEAGPDKTDDPLISSGGGWLQTSRDPRNFWGFSSTTQHNLKSKDDDGGLRGRTLTLPRGKLLGGTSSINALIWNRAAKAEYDALEDTFGNVGWNFQNLLPYFKKAQSHHSHPSDLFKDDGILRESQGSTGPVKTSFNWWYSSLISPFLNTLQSLSFKINSDPNGGNSLGLINAARNIDVDSAKRQSSATTYLAAAASRSNITVLVEAQVRRVIFSENAGDLVAIGVEYQVGLDVFTVKASKEVVLCAGAYQTPQILELSGIGLRSVLQKHGIPVKIDLPVGENLQDHLQLYLIYNLKDESVLQSCKPGQSEAPLPDGFSVEYIGDPSKATRNISPQDSVTGGPYLACRMKDLQVDAASGHESYENLVFILEKLLSSSTLPRLTRAQYMLQREWLTGNDVVVTECHFIFGCLPGCAGVPTPTGTMTLWLPTCNTHPTTRGSVHISSSDPLVHPEIDLNCLDDYELEGFVRMMKFGEAISRTEPFASLIDHGALLTEDQMRKYIREECSVQFHPVGTAPMCPREMGGVVDSHLKVYGTQNLRVVDASILPLQIGAMPQATIYAIAEKAADIIRTDIRTDI